MKRQIFLFNMSIYIKSALLKYTLFVLAILALSSCRDWEDRAELKPATPHTTASTRSHTTSTGIRKSSLNDIKARQLLSVGSHSVNMERLGQAD